MTDINFSINVGLHMSILFSFLSVFFVFYITKISKSALEKEIKESIEKAIKEGLGENEEEIKSQLSKLPLTTLTKLYDKPEKGMQVNNEWLKRVIVIVNVSIWALLLTVIIVLKYVCGIEVPLKELLIENAITFAFIGVVEYLFFTKVALKYIPVEPSFLTQQFVNSVKKNLVK